MPETAVKSSSERIEIRVRAEQKSAIVRAAALQHTDVTSFILGATLPAAEQAIERAERLVLSERDTLRVLDLLENPPEPSERLIRAARLAR